MQRVLSIAEFMAAQDAFNVNDEVIIRDTSSNLYSLTAQQIARMGEFNVDLIDCSNLPDASKSFVWNVVQAKALVGTNVAFTPDSYAKLFDAPSELQKLTAIEIGKLDAKGLYSIRSNPPSAEPQQQTYDAARFHALGNIVLDAADKIYVTDAAQNFTTLTQSDLMKLGPTGKLTVSDGNPLGLSIQQLAVLSAGNFASGTSLFLRDTAANLQIVTNDNFLINGLANRGVQRIDSIDNVLKLSVAQAQAWRANAVELTASGDASTKDEVTLGDTAANLKLLTKQQISDFGTWGIALIAADGGALTLSVDQVTAMRGKAIKCLDSDTVTLSDTLVNLQGLSPADISLLKDKGVDLIAAGSTFTTPLILSVEQALALLGTNVKFAPGDYVVVHGSAAELAGGFDEAELAALADKGVDMLDADDNFQVFNVAEFNALGAIVLGSNDAGVIVDRASILSTLSDDQLIKFRNKGISAIKVSDLDGNKLTLPVYRFNALQANSIKLSDGDDVTLTGTASMLKALQPFYIEALADKFIDKIAVDEKSWSITATWLTALFKTPIKLLETDSVTLSGSASELHDLVEARIGQMSAKGIDTIEVTGTDPLVLSAEAAASLAGTALAFTASSKVKVSDLRVDVEGLSAQQITKLGQAGVDEIEATGTSEQTPLVLTAEKAAALAHTDIKFADGTIVFVRDTKDNLAGLLDETELSALAAKGNITLDSSDNLNVFTIAEFKALGGIKLAADDNKQIWDSGANFKLLDPFEIAEFAVKGINAIAAMGDGKLTLSMDQLNALGTVSLAAANTVTLADTPAKLQALSPNDISALKAKFIDYIDSTAGDGALSLTVAQAMALIVNGIGLTAGDNVVLADTAANLQGMADANLIAQLGALGIKQIDCTSPDNKLALSVAQAFAFFAAGIALTASDEVTLADTAANLQALQVTQNVNQIRDLDVKGVDFIHATGGSFLLSMVQAKALAETTSLKLQASDNVTLSFDPSNLTDLTGTLITKLGQKGLDVIDVFGVSTAWNLSFDQAKALAGTAITLAEGDDVTLTLTAAQLQELSGPQITALRAKGVDHINITGLNNDALVLTIAQLDAFLAAGVDVASIENVTIRDRGAILGALTPEKIAQLAGMGINDLDAVNDILIMNMAQLNGLGAVQLTAGDTITLLDTTAWLSELTAAQIAALSAKGVDKINVLDDEWTMTIAQAKALAASGISLVAADDVTLSGTAAELGTLGADDITDLGKKHLDIIDVTSGSLILSAAQAAALADTASLHFSADDVVRVSDTGAALAGLTATQLAALSAKGIDSLDATDNQLALSLAQFAALGNIALTAGDTVTLSDTGANLAGLTAAQIGALEAKGIDTLDAIDDQLALSLAQFAALGNVALTAGDAVTLSGTGAALAGLTALQIGALKDKGVDVIDASDNSINFSLEQFNALGALNWAANDIVKVQGTQSADTFEGRGGNQVFFGLGGNDVIKGSAGNTTFYGGAGNDVLHGGSGNDIFVFDTALNSRSNKDRILNWDKASDTIYLENVIFKALKKTGTLSKSSFVVGSSAKDANDYIGYNKTTGDLWYDSNGSKAGGQVVFANIGAKQSIAFNDFIII